MKSKWLWRVLQLSRRIWVRASLFCVLAVVTALLGLTLSPYIPSDLPTRIGADAVDSILGIIASSMLTVTTFSLSVMVAAYSAATSNVTPRATQLVIEDSPTQNALSTFVGSFLFSLVGIIILSTGAYGAQGRVVLFGATILVIAFVVVTLLRWMDHLSRLGRVAETTERVEHATAKAMRQRHRSPHLGGNGLDETAKIPAEAKPVPCKSIGYIQHVDTKALSALIKDQVGAIYLAAIPGDFVYLGTCLASFTGPAQDDMDEAVRGCFSIADTRSFDQDPRFGASVLAEIASRALSPAINDPGTAIDVIGRAVRIMAIWSEPVELEAPSYPKIFVPSLDTGDLFDDLFTPIARDGASMVEIGLRLQKAFLALIEMDAALFGAHALKHSQLALERSRAGLVLGHDIDRVMAAAASVSMSVSSIR